MLRKLFRAPNQVRWDFLEKETVDEIIFKIPVPRDRLLVEVMARGGLRVSEALKLTPRDVEDRRLILREPKSGREEEVVFIPQKVAERLKAYIRETGIAPEDRIFPIGYAAARVIVRNAGKRVGVRLSPHDLRRHAATYASRSGTPIEIISKIILRHANLATTQRYLGKVSDTEAMRWIETLYG
jgi:integrase/recombinase XerD